MSPRRRIVDDATWVVVGQVGTIAGRLAALKVLTNLLVPEVFGEVTLLLGVAALATTLWFQPLAQGALRFYPEALRDGRLDALRRLAGRTLAASGGVSMALLAAGAALWLKGFAGAGSAAGFVLVGGLVAADAWRSYECNYLNAARDQRGYALLNILDAWLKTLLGWGAVRLFGPTATSVVTGHLAAAVAVGALAWRAAASRAVTPDDRSAIAAWVEGNRGAYRRFVVPLIPFALFGWIIGISDRFFIAALAGTEAAGLYGAIYGIGSQPFIALTSVWLLTFRPVVYDAVSRGDRAKERHTTLVWLAAAVGTGAVGAALLSAFAPWVVRLATGPAFVAGAGLLPWIAAAYALQGAQVVFETRIFARQRTMLLLTLQGIGAIASIVLYLTLIPKWGARGAAIGTFAAIATSFVASVVLAARAVRAGSATPREG